MASMLKIWQKYSAVYISGLVGTLWISLVTVALGTLLGMLVALMRMGRSKLLRGITDVYIEVLRGTPILLQLYFFWIGLPKIMPFEDGIAQGLIVHRHGPGHKRLRLYLRDHPRRHQRRR